MQDNQKLQRRDYPTLNQTTATFLLWALLAVALAPAVLSAPAEKATEGMVYCPLSRKFQPANPPRQRNEFKPFRDICANAETKDFLFLELVVKNSFRTISLDENNLDNLAFDFLTHGKSALKELPNKPGLPPENLIARAGSSTFTGNNYRHESAWKQSAQYFSLTMLARPPTDSNSVCFARNLIHSSDAISPSIAPRAPPVRS